MSTLRLIEGVKPGAVKAASPVLNGGDEETGLCRPRLVATQLECANFGTFEFANSIRAVFAHRQRMIFSLGADVLSNAARQVAARLDVVCESYDRRES